MTNSLPPLRKLRTSGYTPLLYTIIQGAYKETQNAAERFPNYVFSLIHLQTLLHTHTTCNSHTFVKRGPSFRSYYLFISLNQGALSTENFYNLLKVLNISFKILRPSVFIEPYFVYYA